MTQAPNESPVFNQAEIGCLSLVAALPAAVLLCTFLLAWMQKGVAAVVVGVVGAVAAIPAGCFAGFVLRKRGNLSRSWVALGVVSWMILIFTDAVAVSLLLFG